MFDQILHDLPMGFQSLRLDRSLPHRIHQRVRVPPNLLP